MARLRRMRRWERRGGFAAMLRMTSEEELERRRASRMTEESRGHGERPPWPLEVFGDARSFRVTCPPPKPGKPERMIGVAFTMPHHGEDPGGPTAACLDAYGKTKSPGCREFPSRRLALAWLSVMAKDVEC